MTMHRTRGGALRRLRLPLAVCTALIGATAGPQAPGETAPTAIGSHRLAHQVVGPDLRSDFDGDGYEDLAIAAPFETSGYGSFHGGVTVVYGSAGQLEPDRSRTFTPEDLGQPNDPDESKFFGLALAAGDFDGDGFDDLAVGAPGQWVGPVLVGGAVDVLYGSASGLTAVGAQTLTQDTPGVGSAAERGDSWGRHLTAGDFDGDGIVDLAVGDPEEDVGPVREAGAVNVLFGTTEGLTGAGSLLFTQANLGVGRPAENAGAFGEALAAGELDSVAGDDLAIGARGALLRGVDAGAVNVLYSAAGGLGSGTNQFLHQDSPGIGGIPEGLDDFGGALAVGDLNGSGIDDLVVGVAGEDVGSANEAGVVQVLYGRAGGLSGASSVTISQDTAGVGSTAETSDLFGDALAVDDLDGDGVADLAVGGPSETVGSLTGAGAVNVLYGAPGRLTGAGSQLFTQDTAGIGSAAEPFDHFGGTLSTGDFDGSGTADLTIGTPEEAVGSLSAAGAVHVLHGGPDRLDARTSQLLTGAVFAGGSDGFERFGGALVDSSYY